jgi:hypothetical protein
MLIGTEKRVSYMNVSILIAIQPESTEFNFISSSSVSSTCCLVPYIYIYIYMCVCVCVCVWLLPWHLKYEPTS